MDHISVSSAVLTKFDEIFLLSRNQLLWNSVVSHNTHIATMMDKPIGKTEKKCTLYSISPHHRLVIVVSNSFNNIQKLFDLRHVGLVCIGY